MAHKEEDWVDGLENTAPIIPEPGNREYGYKNEGWKFYLKLRNYLPDYWEEFNNSMSQGRLKYKGSRDFSKAKFKNKDQRQLFYWMICPREEYEEYAYTSKDTKKHAVPWLGDWRARRKNGYWNEDNAYNIKRLNKVLKENLESVQAIKAAGPFLIQDIVRFDRLEKKIDEAFGGKVFLDEAPTSKNSIIRFKIYSEMMEKAHKLKTKAIHEWTRLHGIDPNQPHQMFDMATLAQMSGQIGAAGALTGVAASYMLSNPNGQAPTVLSRDALLLADHLTTHTKVLGTPKEGISVIDGVEVNTKHKDNPKEKANGKHTTQ